MYNSSASHIVDVGDGATCFSSSGHINSLDGLRALSIILVLLAHLCGTRGFWFEKGIAEKYFSMGNLGVRVFFVISGFLITSLLLHERERNGEISLRNFYIRRSLRIFPAGYTVIAIAGLSGLFGLLQVNPGEFLAACTYTMNCIRPDNWTLAHLWSLAVEEQFYIIWPLALSLFGKRRAMLLAMIMFILGPCARFADSHWAIGSVLLGGYSFLANADALASGCLLGGLWGRMGRWKLYDRFQRSWLFLCVPFAACACSYYWRLRWSPLGVSMLNVSIALCIDWCVRNHSTVIGRLLNWRPLTFVGVLSYSLYLWQQPFINRGSSHFINMFPYNLIGAIVCALLSYYLIEKPFLKLRKRWGR